MTSCTSGLRNGRGDGPTVDNYMCASARRTYIILCACTCHSRVVVDKPLSTTCAIKENAGKSSESLPFVFAAAVAAAATAVASVFAVACCSSHFSKLFEKGLLASVYV